MGTQSIVHGTTSAGVEKAIVCTDAGALKVDASLVLADGLEIGSVNVMNVADTVINPATQETLATIALAVASGLPTMGTDATGADAYATAVTAPARQCHYLHVSVVANGAIISLDGGTTDHFAIPANTERLFSGLVIPSGAVIQAKNLVGAANFTLLYVSVW